MTDDRTAHLFGKLIDHVIDAMADEGVDAMVRQRVINRVITGSPETPEPLKRAEDALLGDIDNWKPTGFLGGRPKP